MEQAMFWLTFTFCTLSASWENESKSRTCTCGHLGDVRGFYFIVLKNGSCKFYYFSDNLQAISLWNCELWWITGVCGNVCKTPFSCFMNHRSKFWKDKENSPEEQVCEPLSSVIYSPCRPLLWLPNVQGVLPVHSHFCSRRQLVVVSGNSGLVISIWREYWVPRLTTKSPKLLVSLDVICKPQVVFLGFWTGNFELARSTPFLDFTSSLECLTEPRGTLCFTGVLERNL